MFMNCDHFTPKKQKERDKDNEKINNDWCRQHQWNDLIIKSIQTCFGVNHSTKECARNDEKVDD